MESLLKLLQDMDRETKPTLFDNEVATLVAYYDDVSRGLTAERLAQMGLGLKNNEYPIEVSLLRRIIDRISVVYKNPPTRWLRGSNGARLDELGSETQHMREVLEKAQYDLAWRRVDRIRSLVRQCVIRFYPSDVEGSVVVRVFTPDMVFREVDPVAADYMEEDRQFALALGGGIYEHFVRLGDGRWSVQWVDEKGEQYGAQPYPDGILPFDELPVQIIYDDYSGGRAWLPPRCSRLSWVMSINGISNDLMSLIANQAHDKAIFKTDNVAAMPPDVHGHSTAGIIGQDDDFSLLQSNPKIAECESVLETLIRLWMVSEDLPVSELDKSKQVVTGASLKVMERPLISRMESQKPLATRDEARAWRKFRAVHNRFADVWGVEAFDLSTEMEVEIADLVMPMDMRELQDASERDMKLGAASTIDHIQARFGLSRSRAIELYERVRLDQEDYPISSEAKAPSMEALMSAPDEEDRGGGPGQAPDLLGLPESDVQSE